MARQIFEKEYTIRLLHVLEQAADQVKYPVNDQTNFIIFDFHNRGNQRWRFIPTDKNEGYVIISAYNGKIVSADKDEEGVELKVQNWKSAAGDNIVWYPRYNEKTGGFQILNEKGTLGWNALGSDVKSGHSIGLWRLGTGNNEIWAINPVDQADNDRPVKPKAARVHWKEEKAKEEKEKKEKKEEGKEEVKEEKPAIEEVRA